MWPFGRRKRKGQSGGSGRAGHGQAAMAGQPVQVNPQAHDQVRRHLSRMATLLEAMAAESDPARLESLNREFRTRKYALLGAGITPGGTPEALRRQAAQVGREA